MGRLATTALCVALVALCASSTWARRADGGRAWVVLEDSVDAVQEAIDQGLKFGVTELQLSHNIIMDIDDVFDEARAARINTYIDMAHAANMTAVVWTHEFNAVGGVRVCFEPSDPVWESRREAYRRGLAAIPEVDGVVLMFGSSSLEPWYAMCTCDYCTSNTTVPSPLRPLLIPSPPERVEMLVRLVHDVVTVEHGLKVIVRMFTHRPVEIEYLHDAFMRMQDIDDLIVMSKDVPQDFEPYYPRDPLVGAFPWLAHIVEADAAGEYWGRSVLPFAAPAYWERRMQEFPVQLDGYAARVSRDSDRAIGTPNEVNLLSLQRIFENSSAIAEDIMQEFVATHYGAASPSAQNSIARALAMTQDIGRKMYYFLGFWALEKSSSLPSALHGTPLLVGRSIARYDEDYTGVFMELLSPTRSTLVSLRQEKLEALQLSAVAQSLVSSAASLDPSVDLSDLSFRLRHQSLCTDVWSQVAESVWAYRMWRTDGADEAAAWVVDALDRLDELADLIEDDISANDQWPCDAISIRELVVEMRPRVPADVQGALRKQTFVFPPTLRVASDGTSAELDIRLEAAGTAEVQFGEKAPTYGAVVPTQGAAAVEHSVTLSGLVPGKWYALRVVAQGVDEQGEAWETSGSDYWFCARPTFRLDGW